MVLVSVSNVGVFALSLVLIEDTLRLRSEEAVMSEVCVMTSLLQVKVVMAVICWEWPLSSCSLSPV